jgi:transcriptional regulator with XRE-family HTH domain
MIGHTIRRLREARGLSQEDLALATHMSSSYLSKLERGLVAPTAAVLQKLAVILQASLADLYREAGLTHLLDPQDPAQDPALELYLHQIDRLPEHDRTIITRVLQRILAEERAYEAGRPHTIPEETGP